MDAHLLENSVVQENQQLAFAKYQTLPAYELAKKALQATSVGLHNQISTLEQAIEKVSEKIGKLKPGIVTQTGKSAKKQSSKKSLKRSNEI